MNIVLIGYRGSGKSTVGRKLASALWMEFVDTDTLLTDRAGKSIKEIFAAEGEAGFRDREAAVIQEVAGRDNHVIAAGGGAVLRAENVAALKKNGKVIWLQASPDALWRRIQADEASIDSRPNLTVGGIEEIKTILEARTPVYEGAADAKLDVTYLDPDRAVEYLTKML